MQKNMIVIIEPNGTERNVKSIDGIRLKLSGHNNTIRIWQPNCFDNCEIQMDGNNNILEIRPSTIGFHNMEILMLAGGNNRRLTFGCDCSSESLSIFHHESGSNLIIGNNVMFARNCTIQTTDSHAILDRDTHKLINNGPHTVTIGDNVWVAQGASILKNAKIPSNTIIATGAVVTSAFDDENIIIGGMPARILKRGIVWRRNQINAIINTANKLPIDPADITFVVQGAVDKKWTPQCLDSIRQFFPASHVILSTWAGADVSDIKYLCDNIILNDDPGAIPHSNFKQFPTTFNLDRQIVSTRNGLKAVKTKYAIKIRSDSILTGTGFLNYYNALSKYDKKYKLFSNRIVSFAGYRPKSVKNGKTSWLFCMHDYAYFGLTSDLLKLWDIPLMNDIEKDYWHIVHHDKWPTPRDKYEWYINRWLNEWKPRYQYHAEQYILVKAFAKLKGVKIPLENMFDFRRENDELFKRILANNFVPLYPSRFGVSLPKNADEYNTYYTSDLDYTYPEFLEIYNKYANGDADIPATDTERENWTTKHIEQKPAHKKSFLYRLLHFYWIRGKR